MYPQYPQYSYPYSAGMSSGAYAPVPVYAPHQQAYYPQPYIPQPAVSAAPAAPSAHRLPIRDPSTGLVVPVVTSEQVEDAVKTYHRRSKPSDLVDLDLEELFVRCQAHLPQNVAVQDSGDFASDLLLNAARKGLPFSQYYVGRCFEQGKGIAGDQSQCQKWFQKAADGCVPEAMYKMAQCFEDGWGCVRDLAKAVDLYTEAAAADVAAAQLRLGVMYENGIGMRVNYKEALTLFSKAQDLAEAQYHVARCYDHGIGTIEDKTKAVHWYTKARNSGFMLAANRLREVRLASSTNLQDTSNSEKAVVSSEKAAGSVDSPAGIPPQGSKLAGTKPDPKAKPFTPGANGLQRGDSGLSRSESSGSVRPDPRAKPFVPPPSLAAKLSAKQGDGWGSDSGSVKSDASGASGGGTQASWMPASKPQGKGGQLKAQAQAFQPKAQMLANKQGAGEAPIIGKQPEAVVPVVPPDEPLTRFKSAKVSTATPGAKQKDELKDGKSPSKTIARAGSSQGAAWQEVRSESGPVEDLDELHTLQMSTAWTALEQASAAFPPDINALKAAIRQARPFEELKGYVSGAESLLASLERGERQPAASIARQPSAERQASASAVKQPKLKQALANSDAAQPKQPLSQRIAVQQGGAEAEAEKRKDSPVKAQQPADAKQEAEAVPQPESARRESAQQAEPELPDSPQRAEASQTARTEQADPAGPSEVPQASTPALQQENQGEAVRSASAQAQAPHSTPETNADTPASQQQPPAVAQPTMNSSGATATAHMHQDAQGGAKSQDTDKASVAAPGEPQQTGTVSAADADAASASSSAASSDHQKAADGVSSKGGAGDEQDAAERQAGSMQEDEQQQVDKSRVSGSEDHQSKASAGGSADQQQDGTPQEAAATAAPAATPSAAPVATSTPASTAAAPAAASAPAASTIAPAAAPAPAATLSSVAGSLQDFLSFLLPAENPSTSASPSSVAQSAPVKQPQPSRRAARPYQTTARAPVAPYCPPGTVYDPSQAEARQSGADAHQANAYNPLQSENSGYSDGGQVQPGLPEREQSSEAVLADILGGWGGLGGTPSKSGRPAATSAGASREASRSPVLSAPSGPRYQPPLSSERLQAEAPDKTGASEAAAPAGAAAGTAAGTAVGMTADAALPAEQPAATGRAAADKDASHGQLSTAASGDELASVQQESEATAEGEAPISSQQDKSVDQAQTDAQADTSGRANPGDQPQGSSQQGEEESWQEANERRKVRAVDADYSVTSSKAGRNKAQVKPGKKTSEEGALQQPGNGNMARATSTSSEASSAEKAAVLPPKPKPGAPKARKASQPRSLDDAEDVPQVQGPPPQQPPPNAPAPKQQTQPQRPAPPQTSSQTPQQQAQTPKQQPPLQRPAPPQPSGQGPSSQQPQPKPYQPSPAAILLPANSAWAKKLDLQSVTSSSSSSAAASAAAVPPARQPSQPPQPTPAAKPSSSSSTSTVKAIPMPERPASAGAKGKGKGKTKGQAKQAPVAQPSAGASSSPGKRGSSVKEVPAKDKDSCPKASKSTVPGLEKKSAAPGLQDSGPQQRDVKKQQEGAMITIIQDGMRVTAANRQAWIEICTCPLSLDIMTDPVVASDGITYERHDIQDWMDLKTVQKSPWTDEVFDTKDLTPNLLVLQLIQQFNLIESGL